MNNEEMRELIKLVREDDAIASSRKWRWRESMRPSDYNYRYFEVALQKFMDTIADLQYETINDYVQTLQDVCEGVNDKFPHWRGRIQATGSEDFSDVMNSVCFWMCVKKIRTAADCDSIENIEKVYVDLTLVDAECECDTEPTAQIPPPYLNVRNIQIVNLQGPIPAAEKSYWSPFICEHEPDGVRTQVDLVAPDLQISPAEPGDQGSYDDMDKTAYITMGISEIRYVLRRLEVLFSLSDYKVLTRAESRDYLFDYHSTVSGMKGFLEALRDDDDKVIGSKFERMINNARLRRARKAKD